MGISFPKIFFSRISFKFFPAVVAAQAIFLFTASDLWAQTCEAACQQTTESGVVETTDDSGAALRCCCVEVRDENQEIIGFESKTLEECNFD